MANPGEDSKAYELGKINQELQDKAAKEEEKLRTEYRKAEAEAEASLKQLDEKLISESALLGLKSRQVAEAEAACRAASEQLTRDLST